MIYENHILSVPGIPEDCKAELTSFIPDRLPHDNRNVKHKAMIICPGGGYDYISVREAEPIALRFASYDVTCFVLSYSCCKEFPIDLLQLAAAVKFARENAEQYGIDPEKIFVSGFSAGGHLAASLGVHWNKPFVYEALGTKPEMIKPCGQILCYPVITSGEKRHDGSIMNLTKGNDEVAKLVSLENQVDEDTVPTFIWSTFDDGLVPVENTIMFTAALTEHKIPFTSHIFSSGVHGLALSDECTANYDGHINPECAQWVQLALDWIRKQ